MVATAELPDALRSDLSLYTGCMAWAARIDALEQMLQGAGFEQVRVSLKDESRDFIRAWAPRERRSPTTWSRRV
jgi:hypothetical protein